MVFLHKSRMNDLLFVEFLSSWEQDVTVWDVTDLENFRRC